MNLLSNKKLESIIKKERYEAYKDACKECELKSYEDHKKGYEEGKLKGYENGFIEGMKCDKEGVYITSYGMFSFGNRSTLSIEKETKS